MWKNCDYILRLYFDSRLVVKCGLLMFIARKSFFPRKHSFIFIYILYSLNLNKNLLLNKQIESYTFKIKNLIWQIPSLYFFFQI